jgi:hypothetical protein
MDKNSDFHIPFLEKTVAYLFGIGFWMYFNYKTLLFSQSQLQKYRHINGLEDSFLGFKRVFNSLTHLRISLMFNGIIIANLYLLFSHSLLFLSLSLFLSKNSLIIEPYSRVITFFLA